MKVLQDLKEFLSCLTKTPTQTYHVFISRDLYIPPFFVFLIVPHCEHAHDKVIQNVVFTSIRKISGQNNLNVDIILFFLYCRFDDFL